MTQHLDPATMLEQEWHRRRRELHQALKDAAGVTAIEQSIDAQLRALGAHGNADYSRRVRASAIEQGFARGYLCRTPDGKWVAHDVGHGKAMLITEKPIDDSAVEVSVLLNQLQGEFKVWMVGNDDGMRTGEVAGAGEVLPLFIEKPEPPEGMTTRFGFITIKTLS